MGNMQQENKIQQKIRLDISDENTRVFRNHVGTGYSPQVIEAALSKVYDPELQKTMRSILNKGRMTFGFGEGSSDLVGIKSMQITEDMVGKKIGVFFAIEVKDPQHSTSKERLEKQCNFVNMIRDMGGMAGFAMDSSSAEKVIETLNLAEQLPDGEH